ncbi:MAG: PPC domain-containing DNA-binding protein [Candidatus Micrarchaeota archaeon]
MEFRKDAESYAIRLARGERLFESMQKFFEQTGVKGGELQAIGAVDEVTLGWYDVGKVEYVWKTVGEELEVASLLGTVTEAGLHAHGVFSDRGFRCFGGHVKDLRVSATLEIFLREQRKIRRQEDKATGLKLMEL